MMTLLLLGRHREAIFIIALLIGMEDIIAGYNCEGVGKRAHLAYLGLKVERDTI